jgi:hypothetical protein
VITITDKINGDTVTVERDGVAEVVRPWYMWADAGTLATVDQLQTALNSGDDNGVYYLALALEITIEHAEPTVAQRVQAGVDEIISRDYTLREIDLDILDMENPCQCPAGQTFGYVDTYRAMSGTAMAYGDRNADAWMIAHGFYYHDSDDRHALDVEWRRVISEAQSNG